MLPHRNSVKRELQHYVESGEVDKTRETLKKVCYEHRVDRDQYKQRLLDAEQTSEISIIKLLLEYDPKYTEEFQDKTLSALWIAVLYGHQNSAELLVRSGSVDLNEPLGVNFRELYDSKSTVLHVLIQTPNSFWTERILALLVDHGADLEARDSRGKTPLHYAVSKEQVKLTELLLEKGADVNAKDNEDETPLLMAAKSISQAEELLPLLLRYGADVTAKNSRGCNVLYNLTDAPGERVDLARALIEKGALVNGCTDQHIYSSDPLRHAICLNKYELVKLYLDHGADLKNRDFCGQTVLHCAVTQDQVRVTELLLERGADVNVADDFGETPLLAAARSNKVDELLPLLLRHGADISARNSRGCNVLCYLTKATDGEHVDLARVLIEKGVRVAIDGGGQDGCKYELLLNAVFFNKDGLVKLYLDNGAELENRDSKGQTVVHIAVTKGYVQMTELLLQKGANVNARDNGGTTPLLAAVISGKANNELLPLLINYGADVRAKNSIGRNALHLLTGASDAESRVDLARFLIEKGVPLNDGELSFGDRPLAIAIRFKRSKLVKLFLDHIDLNDRDLLGRTLLHSAVRQYNVEMIKLLLEKGADVDTKDNEGETPLLAATEFQYLGVLKALLKHGASIDLRTNNDGTALHYACVKFRQRSIQTLMSAGADMLVEDKDGKTPFALIKNKNIKNWCIRLMLQKLALIRACQPLIELKDEKIIEKQPELRRYYQDCFIEIAKMKSMSLTNTDSVLDLLTKSHHEISELIRNREFETKFKLHDLRALRIYDGKHIRRALKRAKSHYRSWLKQQNMINEAVFCFLPDLVVRKVLRYMFYDCCRSVE